MGWSAAHFSLFWTSFIFTAIQRRTCSVVRAWLPLERHTTILPYQLVLSHGHQFICVSRSRLLDALLHLIKVLDKRMLIILITLLSRWLPWPWCLLGRGSGCRAYPLCRWARRRTPFAAGLVRCPARRRPRTPWSQLSYHHGSGSWRHMHKQKKQNKIWNSAIKISLEQVGICS